MSFGPPSRAAQLVSNYVLVEPATAPNMSSAVTAPRENELSRHFRKIVNQCDGFDAFCKGLSQIIVDHSDCSGLWLIGADESSGTQRRQPLIPEAEKAWELIQTLAPDLIAQSAGGQLALSIETQLPGNHQLIAVPIVLDQQTEFVLCSYCSLARQSADRQAWLMLMASQATQLWCQRHHWKCQAELTQRLGHWLQLTSSLSNCHSPTAARLTIVNQLRAIWSANQVALCIAQTPDNPLVAVSDVEQLDPHTEVNRGIRLAGQQSLQLQSPIWYHADAPVHNQEALPLQHYAEQHGWATCASVPLKNGASTVVGSLLIAWKDGPSQENAELRDDSQLLLLIADQLALVERANQNVIRQAFRLSQNWLRTRVAKLVGSALLLFAITMCLPLPYQIASTAQLQPIKRRYVAAPYDGTLERTLVQHGEIVKPGQVLAKMDGRQLRLELAGLEAELVGARKRCDSARAVGQIAQSQIAASEMKRISADIEILRQRLQNLEIKSPLGGIVVSGDLEDAEGAPLEMGQNLFEIGPLRSVLAEVGIPEDEIQYAKPGMSVRIKFNSLPFETFLGKVKTIRPRAELLEDKSVFVAEVELDNSDGKLRPGMKGAAKIQSERRSLGWNLFHRGWESVRYWWVW